MTQMLTVVTIAYVIILVLVLAITLMTILFYLRRIGTTLGQIGAGLKVVDSQTAPLGNKLEQINGGLVAVSEGGATTATQLSQTDALLGTVLGESPAETAAA